MRKIIIVLTVSLMLTPVTQTANAMSGISISALLLLSKNLLDSSIKDAAGEVKDILELIKRDIKELEKSVAADFDHQRKMTIEDMDTATTKKLKELETTLLSLNEVLKSDVTQFDKVLEKDLVKAQASIAGLTDHICQQTSATIGNTTYIISKAVTTGIRFMGMIALLIFIIYILTNKKNKKYYFIIAAVLVVIILSPISTYLASPFAVDAKILFEDTKPSIVGVYPSMIYFKKINASIPNIHLITTGFMRNHSGQYVVKAEKKDGKNSEVNLNIIQTSSDLEIVLDTQPLKNLGNGTYEITLTDPENEFSANSFIITLNKPLILPLNVSYSVDGKGYEYIISEKRKKINFKKTCGYTPWSKKKWDNFSDTMEADTGYEFISDTQKAEKRSATRVGEGSLNLNSSKTILTIHRNIYCDQGKRGWWNGYIIAKQRTKQSFPAKATMSSFEITSINENFTLFQYRLPENLADFEPKIKIYVQDGNQTIATLEYPNNMEKALYNDMYRVIFWYDRETHSILGRII